MLLYLHDVTTLELNLTKCNGCGMCIEVCPHAVFVLERKSVCIVNRDACMECGACALNFQRSLDRSRRRRLRFGRHNWGPAWNRPDIRLWSRFIKSSPSANSGSRGSSTENLLPQLKPHDSFQRLSPDWFEDVLRGQTHRHTEEELLFDTLAEVAPRSLRHTMEQLSTQHIMGRFL